jgi:hypothetical protein
MLRGLALDSKGAEVSLEAEHLMLEVALEDQNRALAMRVLGQLKRRDPGSQTRYLLREVELMLEAEQQRREVGGAVGGGGGADRAGGGGGAGGGAAGGAGQ